MIKSFVLNNNNVNNKFIHDVNVVVVFDNSQQIMNSVANYQVFYDFRYQSKAFITNSEKPSVYHDKNSLFGVL